jgi:3-isopropylmalate/(R)-2-methylmalate dehydratase large subunit
VPQTLFDKLWADHVVRELGDGWFVLHIDRHLLHDLTGAPVFAELSARGLTPSNPELVFATPDHAVSSAPDRSGHTFAGGAALYDMLRDGAQASRVRFFDLGQPGQGIVHVMAPELGIVLPGTTVICGDSHTCTNGALGALAFGVGSSEIAQALATQTLRQRKPRQMRISVEGRLSPSVTAKDLALYLIARFGTDAGTGYAIEYAGSAVQSMDMEGRLTLCNLTVELGAKVGLIAPDETTFAYLRGRTYAPQGVAFDVAEASWRQLVSDEDAVFDRDEVVYASDVEPMVTWGTSPQQATPIGGHVPDPQTVAEPAQRERLEAALAYMGLRPGQSLAGIPVDWVFIGSCANSRLTDLKQAAAVLRGRKVAPGVTAWVVPGSESVRLAAEAEGLDRVFKDSGFQWRQPGCSLCVAANGERVPSGARAVSTSNRNFVGRQGPGARTHLASPATAAAAAITGRLTDVRTL